MMNRRVMDVEHLVIDDVLDDVTRDAARVERLADDDRVVRRVVMREYPICLFDRPRQHGLRQLAAEEPEIHIVEDLVEVVDFALRCRDHLSSVRSLAIIRAIAHLFGRDVRVVNSVGLGANSPAEKLRDKYVGESSMRLCRHVTTHIGDAYEDLPVTNTDRLVQSDVRVVRDVDGRNGAFSIEIPEGLLVKTPDFVQ